MAKKDLLAPSAVPELVKRIHDLRRKSLDSTDDLNNIKDYIRATNHNELVLDCIMAYHEQQGFILDQTLHMQYKKREEEGHTLFKDKSADFKNDRYTVFKISDIPHAGINYVAVIGTADNITGIVQFDDLNELE